MKYKYSIDELSKMASNEWFTDRQRRIFDLYYRRGWAIEDVAAELYISRSTVNTELSIIRTKSRHQTGAI